MKYRKGRPGKGAAFNRSRARLFPPLVFLGGASSQNLEPGYRALIDIVTVGNAALRFTVCKAFAGLLLLVRGEGRLAAEFDTVCLGVGPAARGAFQNAAALQLRRHAKDRKRS